MKANPLLPVLYLAVFAASPVDAQFPNFPAADLVLGAPDFTTPGGGLATPSVMNNPHAIAVDPVSGKVFVSVNSHHRILRFANAASLANGAHAEAVLGQINFSGATSGTGQTKFNGLSGIHLDQQGRLWVADRNNHRVLMFQGAASLSNGAPADLVIGQIDFVANSSGTTANKLNGPFGVFVDASDNLWIADSANHRVLKYPNATSLANGAAATVALGQPNLTTVTAGTSNVKLQFPEGLAMSAAGTLWIAEFDNDRVLRFDNAASLASGAVASGVLGQADFVSGSSGLSATRMNSPTGIALDASGTLYVLDLGNRRVLFFRNPTSKPDGAAADGVICQPDFTSNATGISAREIESGSGHGIAFELSGALWVPDNNNQRVLRFSPDRTGPTLTITSKVPRKTGKASLLLVGTSTDTSGITAVQFRTGRGAFKAAQGTTSWRATARLKRGRNQIEVIATDAVGNASATKRVTVTRE